MYVYTHTYIYIYIYILNNMYMCILYINHYPFKIGGRTVHVSYNLDVFQGGLVIIVNFHLFSKYVLIANFHVFFHLKSVGSPLFPAMSEKT